MSSRTGVDRSGCVSRASVSFLRFLVSLLRPVVLCALIINRVMLVCSGVFRWRPCAPGSAPVSALLFSVPLCHCFVAVSQCLAVSLSCLASHCCRFVLSDMVVVSVASLAVVMLDGGGAVVSLLVCRLWFACVFRLGRLWSIWGFVDSAWASLSCVVTLWSRPWLGSSWEGRVLKIFHLSLSLMVCGPCPGYPPPLACSRRPRVLKLSLAFGPASLIKPRRDFPREVRAVGPVSGGGG